MRYRIVQDDSRWIIVNARDEVLVWAGAHWIDRDQSGAHLVSFPDQAAAEAYARELFAEGAQK